jgi:hypothetical protein
VAVVARLGPLATRFVDVSRLQGFADAFPHSGEQLPSTPPRVIHLPTNFWALRVDDLQARYQGAMHRLPSPPSSFERAPPGRPRDTSTHLALRASDKGIRSGYGQENSKSLILDSSSESAASRSSSGSSSTGFGSSSNHPPATSEPAASQHLEATQPSSHKTGVERTSSPSARASEVVEGIVQHAQSGWPVTTAPFRAVSLDAFHEICEILSHEHGWIWDKLRYNYDPEKAELDLHMPPDDIHDKAARNTGGLFVTKIKAKISSTPALATSVLGRLLADVEDGSTHILLEGGGSRSPDNCVQHPQSPDVATVIEVAHSQKDKELPVIAEEYYRRSEHVVRCIFTMHIEYWNVQQRDEKAEALEVARTKIETELEQLASTKDSRAKDKRMKQLEAEREPQRRRCTYNLYTENAAQTGLNSKFDEDKEFYPVTDPNDSVDIPLGCLFPRDILPSDDPAAALSITILASELAKIIGDAEAKQLLLDEKRRLMGSRKKRTASTVLSGRHLKVLKEEEERAEKEEEGAVDRSKSLSPNSDEDHPPPPVTGHTPKKAHATRRKSAGPTNAPPTSAPLT